PGTLAVTEQSPNETSTFERFRTNRILCKSSSLLTAPSTRAISTFSGKTLASTRGLYTRSASSAIESKRSSVSSSDMWHPEHPSSHTVARRSLLTPILPHQRQIGQKLPALKHFRNGFSFLRQSTRGANVHALATPGTSLRAAPRLI